MSLRTKALLAIGTTTVGLILSLSLVSSKVLTQGFLRIEADDVRHHVRQLCNRIEDTETLITRRDWAAWDDAYTFIEDGNRAFIDSNLTDTVLQETGLEGLIFVHSAGRIVYSRIEDAQSRQELPLPDALRVELQPGSPLNRHTSPQSRTSGLLRVGSRLYVAASLPITTSRHEGPVRGSLVFLRSLHEGFQQRLVDEIMAPGGMLHLVEPADWGKNAKLRLATETLLKARQAEIVVNAVSNHSVEGLTLLRDLYDRPVAALRFSCPRTIYAQGALASSYCAVSAAVMGLIFGLASLILIRKLALTPLLRLKEGVCAITRTQDFSRRVERQGDDELAGLAGDINDLVASMASARAALCDSDNRFRNMVETTNDWVWETDPKLVFTYVNGRVLEILGYTPEEVIGKTGFDFQTSEEQERVRRAFEPYHLGRSPFELVEATLTHKDGRPITVEFGGRPYFDDQGSFRGFRGVGRDVTEKKQAFTELQNHREQLEALVEDRSRELVEAERQLMQNDKLASVGQLAAGIAHEINTPIQYVGDNLQALSEFMNELTALIGTYRSSLEQARTGQPLSDEALQAIQDSEKQHDLDYILEDAPNAIAQGIDGVQRVAHIVRAMKDFSHVDREEMTPTDLNRAVQNTLTVAKNEYKYVADATVEPGDLPSVECFPSEINQVLLNMIVNAAHAIADTGKRGAITVKTRRFDEKTVEIAIADTGAGIPENIRSRIFDPFFTTKEVGKGTGQGLNIAHRVVVERHGGQILLESEVGKGTTFYVRLPVHSVRKAQAAAEATA